MLRRHVVNGILLTFLVVLFSSGCGTKSTTTQAFSGEKFLMDTLVHITVHCENEQQAQDALTDAFAAFAQVNELTDRFTEQQQTTFVSDVNRINQNAGISPVRVSNDTLTIVERSNYFSNLTGGAFDVTIGPVMDLWGFGSKQRVPYQQEIENALSLVDYRKIEIVPQQGTIFLPKQGMGLDLGGVAKGYATDQAALALKRRGIRHAMINAGGNVYAMGAKPDGAPWRVGVQDPRNNGLIAVISVKDAAVVTSGDYQRYFTEGGVRYHHILDPASGKQATDVMQVTVVSDSATDADILSTALFVMGAKAGLDIGESIEGVGAIFVTSDRQILHSRMLTDQLTFTDNDGYQVINGY